MPIDRKLLDILCCPATKVPVEELDAARLAKVNEKIHAGEAKYAGGETVVEALEEALITTDGKTIYEIRNSIPIMLEERGIPAGGLGL